MINNQIITAELAFILDQMPYSYISKLPNKSIERMKKKMSIDWFNKFDKNTIFLKQSFSDDTIELLAKINERFWK